MADQVTSLIICLLHTVSSKEIPVVNIITVDVFCNIMYSNIISFLLRDSDTDSENVSLIRRSVSECQKTCSSKGITDRYIMKCKIP